MAKREETIAELQNELCELERRNAVLLDLAEQVAVAELDLDEACLTQPAHRAAYRAGGRAALAEVLFAGGFRQRNGGQR
jgi:hypothetical protein